LEGAKHIKYSKINNNFKKFRGQACCHRGPPDFRAYINFMKNDHVVKENVLVIGFRGHFVGYLLIYLPRYLV